MDKYEKIRVVGRGAYGIVHLSRRLSDKKLFIIKQIPVEQMTKDERQAALNEVKVLSMLNHINIIEYYENFLEDKALMIVMEYAPGGTLLDYLQSRNGKLLDEEEILKFFAQMLLSLQHVHSKQILHRDLKTQNILLDKKQEIVKIGDFGISKVLSSKSKAFTVVGTPCYISPELCEGKPYNQKSDIWALGCVLYELASLKRAFEAATLPALILKIMRGTFSPISEYYSEELRSLILSMLHLDPNKRPHINQIMAQPIVINALMYLHTDMGSVPCTRICRPLSNMPSTTRGRASAKGYMSPRECLPVIIQALSCVYSWGGGVNSPIKLPLPSSETQVVQVSTGRTQKAAVTKNGRLFFWESPSVSCESLIPGTVDNATPVYVPRYLEGQAAVTIHHVACGDLFNACLTDRGILMTYGSGANGCLGHGNHNDVTQAKIVEALLGYEVVEVSCGASHVLAVTNEHEVFAWGRGDNGRLGLGNQDLYTSPQEVTIPDDMLPCSVHCGVDSSLIVTQDGRLLACGCNRFNKLGLDSVFNDGINTIVEECHTFTPVATHPINTITIEKTALGTSHTAILSGEGELYMLGTNQFGQLGSDEDLIPRQPHHVKTFENCKINTIACGDTFTVAALEDGDVYTWGKGSRGRLGRPEEQSNIPKKLTFSGEDPFFVVSISCSHGNTLLATKPLPNSESLVD
ncbi:hypothetical protein SNE40_011206 [Patella caerulea]|uniref:non-specific serine/threonine protein kinase n=1 Tax=Patella caerulea TaxID=87958 RepID=A0AAN8PL87_PATCE